MALGVCGRYIRPAEYMLVETLVRLRSFDEILGTQPEFKITLMVRRQLHSDLHVAVHLVGADDHTLSVATAILMSSWLSDIKKKVS